MPSEILSGKPEYQKNQFWISVSKAKTFKDCAAKYRFSYILKLPRKDYDYLVLGKLLHEALERFHKILLQEKTPFVEYKQLLADCLCAAQFKDQEAKNAGWKKSISESQVKESEAILAKYLIILEKQQNKPQAIILDLEKSFYVMVDGHIVLNGFIDLVKMDPDGILHVADYKSSKNDKFLKDDYFQLLVYAFVEFLEDPTLEKVRCSYIMLKQNFKHLTKEFTRKEVMEEMEPKFIDIFEEIKKEKLFRPTIGPLCGYCQFSEPDDNGKIHCQEGAKAVEDKPKYSKKSDGSYLKKPEFSTKIGQADSW